MYERDPQLWLSCYAICRQSGDDHATAMRNAQEVAAAMTAPSASDAI